jgi:hypothetical protein
MNQEEKLVAVISPWEKLNELIRRNFRLESLPEEKKVMAWRDDLQSRELLEAELHAAGIAAADVRSKKVTTRWRDVH